MRCFMTKDELKKDCLISAVIQKQITVADCAKRLNLSSRQVMRLAAKFRAGISLLHGNCGKGVKGLDAKLKQNIVDIYSQFNFADSNFLHFKELLWDLHQIKISYNALRILLLNAGFVSPKKHRQKKVHPRRPPKEAFGEMLQTDASSHQFFLPFGDKNFYALHGFIDDATGTITGLYMTKNECSDGYFEALRHTLTHFGCPASVYADGLSLFFSSKREALSKKDILAGIEERRTQFGQIFYDLGIELIHARSSQAKGKIERLWQTLQSRLITEFKIRNIDSIEKANRFLPEYIVAFNKKFSKVVSKTVFLPLSKSIDLDILLSLKFTRKLDSGLCFSFYKNIFKVPDGIPQSTVELLVSKIHGMKVLFKSKLLAVIPLFDGNNNPLVTQNANRDTIQHIVKTFLTRNERVA